MKRSLFAGLMLGLLALAATSSAAAREVYSGQDLILNCKDPVVCDEFLIGFPRRVVPAASHNLPPRPGNEFVLGPGAGIF